jgi:hypothetical protein
VRWLVTLSGSKQRQNNHVRDGYRYFLSIFMADVRVGQQAADGALLCYILATGCGYRYSDAHRFTTAVERLAPQRRSLAGARVDSVEQRNIPTWGPSAIMLLAAVCRVGFA